MEITREAIVERRRVIEADIRNATNMVHALNGALQDLDYWLTVLDAEETKEANGDH